MGKDIVESERWRRVQELYHSALQIAADQHVEFLKNACGGDAKLYDEVKSLLLYESSATEFMETPAFEVAVRQMAGDEESETQVDPVVIGDTLLRFRILEKLGSGGMGVIYRAEDLRLHRTVALKFLPNKLGRDPVSLERFEIEANAASALNHPNICTVYDIGEHEGRTFIAMELLEGQTLDRRIDGQALTTQELLTLGTQIAEGLRAAHEKRIIHRDIKPANIFVTTQGQAKILDFGLAKLASIPIAAESLLLPCQVDSDEAVHAPAKQLAVSDHSISLTGVAMGTAGYMSPEQVRGEIVDARTDLFSFGLVLYEMATGHRAFTGDTGPLLQEAILRQIPIPVRRANPEVSVRLERIITKSIEKDREARYQTASELRADLATLDSENRRKPQTLKWAIAGGVVAVLMVLSVTLWIGRIRLLSEQATLDPKLQQLTNNSYENRVRFGAISPNGRYLAFSNVKGIHIQNVETGETRVVPQPEETGGKELDWEIVSTWFPDSSSFLVNSHPVGEEPSNWSSLTSGIWLVYALGGPPHKLRDNAVAYSISPASARITFATKKGQRGEREVWQMDSRGENLEKLFDTDEGTSIGGLGWSRDGKRILYLKSDQAGDALLSRDLTGEPSTEVFGPTEMKQINDFVWRADGRLLYSVPVPGAILRNSCALWEVRLDPHTGTLPEKPKKLTNWPGFCPTSMSETTDGRKLAFLRWSAQMTSYVADLVAEGTHILQPKHFPLTESSDAVADWAPDSKSVLLVSNRGGNFGLYTQALGKDTAEPLVTQGYHREAHLSPDGKTVFYFGNLENSTPDEKGPEQVMSVPFAGGPPQKLFVASSDSLLVCARSPSNLCAIGEGTSDGKQLMISAVDPTGRRGLEMFRIPLNSVERVWRIALSQDGARFAILLDRAGPIYIYSIQGEMLIRVQVKGWTNLDSVSWNAEGKSLFVTANTRDGSVVLNVNLLGEAHTLWEYTGGGGETLAHPSPDGHRLEFDSWTNSANMWLMENF